MSMPTAEARAPRQERGQARVAAIMEAAAALFREKGFDAVTMSDIAAQSGTAFGSLYRFFPSKEALADALLQQFAQRVLDQLTDLAVAAPSLSPDKVAAALIDFMIALQAKRSLAVNIIETRENSSERREEFRTAVRSRIVAVLQSMRPALTGTEAKGLAIVTLQLLKGAAAAAEETPPLRRFLIGQYRGLLASVLTSLRDPAGETADHDDLTAPTQAGRRPAR